LTIPGIEGGDEKMRESVKVKIPREAAFKLQSIKAPGVSLEEKVDLAIAIDLFTRGEVSLAKAAEIAQAHRYDFIMALNQRGISIYEYGGEERRQDEEAIDFYRRTKR